MAEQAEEGRSRDIARVLTALYKGALFKENDEALWQLLGENIGAVMSHFSQLALRLVKDDTEGYAYVSYMPQDEEDDSGDEPLPRLISRRQLSFSVSLLLALLRKRLIEFDTAGDGTRLIVSREEAVSMMSPFFPATTNEAKLSDKADTALNKVKELGFIRQMRGSDQRFEVLRILKAFVDAQWLQELDAKLEAYKKYGRGDGDE